MSSQIELIPDLKSANQSILNSLQMMKVMAQMGCNRAVFATLLQISGFPLAYVCYVGGSVIMHQSEWAKDVPGWLINACIASRIERISEEYAANESPGSLATPTEVLTALYPATYDAPLPHYLFQIYAWCWNETLIEHNRLPQNLSNGWEMLNMRPIEFEQIQQDYYPLARTIRRKVIETAKPRWKKHSAPSPTEAPETLETPISTQISLFS
ncbi:MAG: hypothetical protein AB4426_19405 [Xenococcaceae cyanobacterium]